MGVDGAGHETSMNSSDYIYNTDRMEILAKHGLHTHTPQELTLTTTHNIHMGSDQELMSGEVCNSGSIQILITYVFPSWTRASASKKKASPNGEGSRDLQIYHNFGANRFHCHPFAWPFHCG